MTEERLSPKEELDKEFDTINISIKAFIDRLQNEIDQLSTTIKQLRAEIVSLMETYAPELVGKPIHDLDNKFSLDSFNEHWLNEIFFDEAINETQIPNDAKNKLRYLLSLLKANDDSLKAKYDELSLLKKSDNIILPYKQTLEKIFIRDFSDNTEISEPKSLNMKSSTILPLDIQAILICKITANSRYYSQLAKCFSSLLIKKYPKTFTKEESIAVTQKIENYLDELKYKVIAPYIRDLFVNIFNNDLESENISKSQINYKKLTKKMDDFWNEFTERIINKLTSLLKELNVATTKIKYSKDLSANIKATSQLLLSKRPSQQFQQYFNERITTFTNHQEIILQCLESISKNNFQITPELKVLLHLNDVDDDFIAKWGLTLNDKDILSLSVILENISSSIANEFPELEKLVLRFIVNDMYTILAIDEQTHEEQEFSNEWNETFKKTHGDEELTVLFTPLFYGMKKATKYLFMQKAKNIINPKEEKYFDDIHSYYIQNYSHNFRLQNKNNLPIILSKHHSIIPKANIELFNSIIHSLYGKIYPLLYQRYYDNFLSHYNNVNDQCEFKKNPLLYSIVLSRKIYLLYELQLNNSNELLLKTEEEFFVSIDKLLREMCLTLFDLGILSQNKWNLSNRVQFMQLAVILEELIIKYYKELVVTGIKTSFYNPETKQRENLLPYLQTAYKLLRVITHPLETPSNNQLLLLAETENN